MVLSKDEQLSIIHSIPESKLNELAAHMSQLQGSGKGKKGAGFWGDAWSWIKKNVAPVASSVGKTLLKDVLLPIIKQKISQKLGGGLSLAGGAKKRGMGLKLAGTGRPAKGSQAAKDKMAAVRAMKKK